MLNTDIRTAIESILNQTYQNWELLIIDDGSTDSSLKILNSYKDNRIRVFFQPRKGVSAARN